MATETCTEGVKRIKPITIAVLGAGPKALALACKAKVLDELGIGTVSIQIIDKSGVGANWTGSTGYTDGDQTLGTPPDKDLGFPYRSIYGPGVDCEMLRYSWQAFRVMRGDYADWVDRGRPAPSHRVWSQYLLWVFDRLQPSLEIAKVEEFKPLSDASGWEIKVLPSTGEIKRLFAHALVLTGPGDPIKIRNQSDSERILNGRKYWQVREIFKQRQGRVAVVGSGETAATILLSLMKLAPELKIDLITRHGTIYTRGESYHENTLYTNPDKWADLDELEREEFINRTDRGVFSVEAKSLLDHIDSAPNVRIIMGSVTDVYTVGGKAMLKLQRKKPLDPISYDYVVVATGFDAFSMLKLLPDHCRPEKWLRDLKDSRKIDEHLRVQMGTPEELNWVPLHMPMVSGLTQGPGFPNLSCLGTLADRILSAYIPPNPKARDLIQSAQRVNA